MKNFIIGTAGHVDHGKTHLIKALTGYETDRLKEEQKRGITIDLGFAHMDLPTGERVGIIDVPGHERFIRNMLAGAGSVDLALLVVSATEGFMPQTREHLDILNLLGIKNGIIAVTKTDLVDDEWIDLVVMDIKEEIKDSFLEDAKIIPLSAHNNEGIDTLKEEIIDILSKMEERNKSTPGRLPIDRVFSVDGFGTVVTGTLIEGTFKEGQDITIYPSGIETKIRTLQVHGKQVKEAYSGQRVAVNLSNIKTEDIERGDQLADPDSMEVSNILDIALEILPSTDREILNNSRLHFHHGAFDGIGRLVLLDSEVLIRGQKGYGQLILEDEVATKIDDNFVLRFYSPVETIGGGKILDSKARRHKRYDENDLEGLLKKDKGNLKDKIYQFVKDRSDEYPYIEDLKIKLFNGSKEFDEKLRELIDSEEIYEIDGRVFHKEVLKEVEKDIKEELKKYHKENPLLKGIRKSELRTRILNDIDRNIGEGLIDILVKKGRIREERNIISLLDFEITMTNEQKTLRNNILSEFKKDKYMPPSLDEIKEKHLKDEKIFRQVLDGLIQEGELIRTTPQIFFVREEYTEAFKIFIEMAEKGSVALGDYRDKLETTRRYALALLEDFDRRGMTKLKGDERVLLSRELNI